MVRGMGMSPSDLRQRALGRHNRLLQLPIWQRSQSIFDEVQWMWDESPSPFEDDFNIFVGVPVEERTTDLSTISLPQLEIHTDNGPEFGKFDGVSTGTVSEDQSATQYRQPDTTPALFTRRRGHWRPVVLGGAARLENLGRWEAKVKDILQENQRARHKRGLSAPTRTSHWSEDAYTIEHTNDPSCPCQRCLCRKLKSKCRWEWDHLLYCDAPQEWSPLPQPLAGYNSFPPTSKHPHYDLFLQLLAVVRKYSRRSIDPSLPATSRARWAFRALPGESRLNVPRWTPETSCSEDDDYTSSTEDDEDRTARSIARRRPKPKKEQEQSRKRRGNAASSRNSKSQSKCDTKDSKRNAAGHKSVPRRKMEGTTASTALLPPHQLHMRSANFTMTSRPHAHSPSPPNTTAPSFMDDKPTTHMPSIPTSDPHPTAWPETPTADKRIDHALPSNLRDSLDHGLGDFPSNDSAAAIVDNGFSGDIFDSQLPYDDNSIPQTNLTKQEPDIDDFDMKTLSTPSNEVTTYAETATADEPDEENDEEETAKSLSAYAMLRFPDSFCLITSMNLVIVRDESYRARYQMQKKEEKKRRKAEQALNEYAREPSHPSLRGDDDAPGPSMGFGDDGDLEGRPARGLLSNFSEQGGAVSYPADSEDEADFEAERARRRRRKNKANSSSANSVAPQDLSIFGGNGDEGEFMQTEEVLDENGLVRDPREWAQLPVHTARPEDIGKISREHLIFSYDMNRQRWVLNVTGRGVVVNAIFYSKGCEAIELNHQDEIFVSTVRMIFELPNQQEVEEESIVDANDDIGDDLSTTTPVRRVSNALNADESEEDGQEEESHPRRPKPVKIKLTNKKKDPAKDAPAPGKGKNKGKTTEQPSKTEASASPEVSKKPEKGKKPKAASAEATGETPVEVSEKPKEESAAPPAPPVIDPNSVLHDLAPDQMPEKRKGPGRPPKNGLLSKRDESAIKRKQREYERKGEQIPELQLLLNIVRAEQRQKDLAAKAAARGEAAPDTPIPSIETDGQTISGAGPSTGHKDSLGGTAGSPTNGDRTSPKPLRRPKSPSPIKPEAEFTEEEMKKPNMTYIYIIDEILQNMEGSQADLQTIYDKIQKRWPYYKYRVNSVGWQSSVRHNLLQCDRFKEAGKSGKGRFWTINFDHPLDNKKKRPSPQPRPPMPPQMANGAMPHGLPHMPPNQYGQPGYPPAYGQPPMNGQANYAQGPQLGQGPYYSPYGGNNYGPGPQRPPSNGPYMQNGTPNPQQHPAQQPPPPPRAPAPAPPPFQRVVDAIMAYRNRFLQPFPPNTPIFAENDKILNRAIQYYSDRFHGHADDGSVSAEEATQDPFRTLKAIFDEHKDLTNAATAAPASNSPHGHAHPPVASQQSLPQASVLNGTNEQQPVPTPASGSGQQSGVVTANGENQTPLPSGNNPVVGPGPQALPDHPVAPGQAMNVAPPDQSSTAPNLNQQHAVTYPVNGQMAPATGNSATPQQGTPQQGAAQMQMPIPPQQLNVHGEAAPAPPVATTAQQSIPNEQNSGAAAGVGASAGVTIAQAQQPSPAGAAAAATSVSAPQGAPVQPTASDIAFQVPAPQLPTENASQPVTAGHVPAESGQQPPTPVEVSAEGGVKRAAEDSVEEDPEAKRQKTAS